MPLILDPSYVVKVGDVLGSLKNQACWYEVTNIDRGKVTLKPSFKDPKERRLSGWADFEYPLESLETLFYVVKD